MVLRGFESFFDGLLVGRRHRWSDVLQGLLLFLR
jgi:hypothetical protein